MIEISMKIADEDKVWDFVRNNKNPLMISGHIGTHIDIYNKSEIPEEYLVREGIFIDCSKYHFDEEIGLECVEGKEINEGDFIIFFTNIQTISKYGEEIYIHQHHQLSQELIDFLLMKKVSFIGIDCAGIRRGEEHIIADKKCEENKTFVIENLSSEKLKELGNSFKKFKVMSVWHKNPLLTGLPVRLFAVEEKCCEK